MARIFSKAHFRSIRKLELGGCHQGTSSETTDSIVRSWRGVWRVTVARQCQRQAVTVGSRIRRSGNLPSGARTVTVPDSSTSERWQKREQWCEQGTPQSSTRLGYHPPLPTIFA